MSIEVKFKNKPKILGLDISTKTIGFALFDISGSNLLELTHFSPKIKPQPEDKIEELISCLIKSALPYPFQGSIFREASGIP